MHCCHACCPHFELTDSSHSLSEHHSRVTVPMAKAQLVSVLVMCVQSMLEDRRRLGFNPQVGCRLGSSSRALAMRSAVGGRQH